MLGEATDEVISVLKEYKSSMLFENSNAVEETPAADEEDDEPASDVKTAQAHCTIVVR